MSPKKDTSKTARRTTPQSQESERFTDNELDAMKERAKELKAEARRGSRARQSEGESELLAKIAGMPDADRIMAERLHAMLDEGAMWPTAFALKRLKHAEEARIVALVKQAVGED